jgi:hypothetical protein
MMLHLVRSRGPTQITRCCGRVLSDNTTTIKASHHSVDTDVVDGNGQNLKRVATMTKAEREQTN